MNVKELIGKRIELIKGIRENPRENLIELIPSIIVVIMFVIHLINYVIFIMKGGYQNQMQQENTFDFDGILRSFTKGEMNTFLEKIDTPLLILLILFGICMLVYLVMVNAENKKVIMGDMIVIAVLAGMYFLFDSVFRDILLRMDRSSVQLILLVYFFIVLVAVGILFHFVWQSKYMPVLKEIIIAGAVSHFVIPSLFVILKNILPILHAGIAIIIILIMLAIMFGLLRLFATGTSSSHGESRTVDEAYERRQKAKPLDINNPDENMWVVPSGIMVHKVHGFMHDYVERSNSLGGSSEVCSLDDLRKGKFLLYDSKGRRLGENDLTWKVK